MSDSLEGMAGGADVATFFDLVRNHAQQQGSSKALTFLRDGESENARLTYAELDERAQSIAGWLQENGCAGERVMLLYPSGLEFVAAFLGCLYAGAIAVPASPPRMNRNALRLMSMVHDAQATLALTTQSLMDRTRRLFDEAGMATLGLVASEDMETGAAHLWRKPESSRNHLAFLQYTSGSTSEPKGVMVSHRNLLENHRMMEHSFGQTEHSKIVTWLPLFHDMGLIGNVLQALYLGVECIILPPEAFLVKPVRWLAAISRYRATFSGAPNFAYQLCAQKITAEQRATLDLSCWESAFVGAEPVRHASLEQFSEAFEGCGFRREALYPCYGLAEASLFVSGAGKLAGARRAWFSSPALEKHRVAEVSPLESEARPLVSCGRTWLEQQIAIVDPEACRRCAPDEVGEIWVSGLRVACGYWNRHEATAQTFAAHLPDDPERIWLRTGRPGILS